MARYSEPDEYKVGSLQGGLPTCVFSPKMYHRVITNIVVGNSATSEVACYRGILGSTPVAQNALGSNNTLRGEIKIPAGQTFFVQWSAAGASVSDAFARVSWQRDDNPLEIEAGNATGQEWSSESVTSLQIPTGAGPDEPAIVIGADLPSCMQANYTSAIIWRPPDTLPPERTPLYFIAQRKNVVAPSTQSVDHGFLIYDGSGCSYTVYRRVAALNVGAAVVGPLLIQDTTGTAIEVSGLTITGQQVQWRGATDIFVLDQSRFFAHGDQLSLRNDCDNGAANANGSTNIAAFANYPTNVSNSITKVGAAGNTNLVVTYAQTFYVDNVDTGPKFGVRVGGNDYETHRVAPTLPVINARFSSVGMVKIPGLAAGAYTVVPRWARLAGTGSVWAVGGDDWTSLKVHEEAV